MKKIIGIFVIALLTSIAVNAQQGQGKGQKGMNLTPEQKATLKAKQMTLALDLNTKQQTEVYNLMKNSATEQQSVMASMKQKRQDGVTISDDEKYEMQKQRLDKKIEHKTAMKNILTKDQYEKWEKMMQHQRKSGKKNMAKNNQKGVKGGKQKNNKV
ncbi:hypothetical protein EC396_07625 [Lutibacter sp. HS1-25]|uniref:hypothetical protein n=1 Tax=Lutibacter sp. HS1-25 TaxID=2485000 RepID=UPI001012FE6C|nr:hypothetical protein [Lutibacter sp. HS1-25]RXP56136.1 hypothetical protein EC396_07625 [Lutibacter sp. HS1-25]